MRRKRCLLLILSFLIGMVSGCARPMPAGPMEPTGCPENTGTSETGEPESDMDYLQKNLPVMDGSTSLIPLEAGIRAAIFGQSQEEAAAVVSHSTTWDAFYGLLDGRVDLIFSCPLSSEQYEAAQNWNVTLETVPIAMEGFVFVVNAQNPVDALTQEQLRQIYSGEITNWAELGGPDAPIIPYQRNRDSGSQNYMLSFMGDVPLMDAPSQQRPKSMEGLMDVVAANDNAAGAIGYSVYAYAADMYGSGSEIKFIRVDGVAPSKQTMASGEYPLMGYNYAVFNKEEPQDGPVRRLVDWMLSFEGQAAIAEAGYVTVRDIGFDYEEMTLSKYAGTGTGPAAQPPESNVYMLYASHTADWGTELLDYVPLESTVLADGTKSFRLTILADTDLQNEVNQFIEDQMAAAREAYARLSELSAILAPGEPGKCGAVTAPPEFSCAYQEGMDAACIVTCKNGYLSVAVSLCCGNESTETDYFRTETATWDLLSGERLAPEALFSEGTDIARVLGAYIRRCSQEPTGYDLSNYGMKQDFAGLTTAGWHLTHDAIYFDRENPYFGAGVRIPLEGLPEGTLVTEQPRDFSGCIASGDCVVSRMFREISGDRYYEYMPDRFVSCCFLLEDAHPNAAGINEAVRDYLGAYFTKDAVLDYFEALGPVEEDYRLDFPDWTMRSWGGKYLVFTGMPPHYYLREEERLILYPHATVLLFDLATGRQLPWQELLLGGWQTAGTMTAGYNGERVEAPDYGALTLCALYQGRDGALCLRFHDGGSYYTLSVPSDYIRF